MKRKIIPYDPKLKLLARRLRNDSTLAEVLLWNELKLRPYNYDFHRQKPLLCYIVDFYCHELNLAIEVDGFSHYHEHSLAHDVKREKELNEVGVKVLRFDDDEVLKDI
ncbi:hypothetical protein D3C80_349210 [compost metagenome]